MQLKNLELSEIEKAMQIIDTAKKHLKDQGIDQWQDGYPDYECIKNDALKKIGYFIIEEDNTSKPDNSNSNTILGYIAIDYNNESAYENINGQWTIDEDYVVVHRMAFTEQARGKKLADKVFELVEEKSKKNNINYMRIDTDADNHKMQHILKKNGFKYCGIVYFDNSEKIAFDKLFNS